MNRIILFVILAATILPITTSVNGKTYRLNDDELNPDGKWKCMYESHGTVKEKNGGALLMTPKVATTADKTHSCLVLSTKQFKNFQIEVDIKTVKQIRVGSPANTWETAWIFWRFTDEDPRSNHHYYWLLKTNGFEFGKKDNAPDDNTIEQQIFLKTGGNPKVTLGESQHITIIAQDYHFIIKVDDVVVVNMVDDKVKDPDKMAKGLVGWYTEDASVEFDNVEVTVLPS